MSDWKAFWTLVPVSAEVSRQVSRLRATKSSIASDFTALEGRSDLLPMRTVAIEGSACSCSSLSHCPTFSKLCRLVRSKTIITPTALLQQAEAMALNLSCPAVSQIWFWMRLPQTWTTLVQSSTPMVALVLWWKVPESYWESRLDLPTPESPTITILKLQSKFCPSAMSQSEVCYQNWYNWTALHPPQFKITPQLPLQVTVRNGQHGLRITNIVKKLNS